MVAPTENGSCFSYPFLFFGVFGCAEFRRFVVRRGTNTVGATNGRPRFAGGIFLFVALLQGEPGDRWSPLQKQNIHRQAVGAGAPGRATDGRPYRDRGLGGKRSRVWNNRGRATDGRPYGKRFLFFLSVFVFRGFRLCGVPEVRGPAGHEYGRGDQWSPAFCRGNFSFRCPFTGRAGRPMVAPTKTEHPQAIGRCRGNRGDRAGRCPAAMNVKENLPHRERWGRSLA